MAKPFKVGSGGQGSDGEKSTPKVNPWPPNPLPQPSEYDAGTMHSPTIPWPAAGGPDDNKPFRIRK